MVYDSQTLTVEWDSRETYTGRADEAAIGDVDRDGVQEILIAGGDHDHPLRRINAITHAVEWDAPAGVSYTGVAVGEANGLRGPEIATVEDGRLTLHDGVTFQVLARTLDMGQQPVQHLLFVRMANAPAAQLVLATQQNVYLFRNPLDATPVQVIDLNPVVSYNYNQPHLAFADVDGDHHLDMLIGDGSGVARYRVIDLLPD